jgi:hypothetical protein
MFFEKWFDSGDLILYSPNDNYLAYDDDFNPYQIEKEILGKVGIFLDYVDQDNFSSCKIFLSSKQRSVIVLQNELKLLSKKR